MLPFNRLSILSSLIITSSYKSIIIPTHSFPIYLTSKSARTLLTYNTISSRKNPFVVSSSLFLIGNSFLYPKKANSSSAFCTTSDTSPRATTDNIKMITGYLNAKDAASLDIELMSQPGYSLEQLMELAGLSVAEAVYQVVPPPPITSSDNKKPNILVVCGPGNNGGDGLVAARHLKHFGYDCTVVYPKPSKGIHFLNLVEQLHNVNVPILSEMPFDEKELNSYDAVIDALFGFSFKGPPREPLASCLNTIIRMQNEYDTQVISVDIPSGWNVNEGDVDDIGFIPDVVISLTAPKLCIQQFINGRHFIGGRFLPDTLATKYNIKMPPYPGVSQVMEIPVVAENDENCPKL